MKFWVILFSFLIFSGSALLFNHHANDILIWIKSIGVIAPIFFCFFYIFATLFFMPTLVITFAGGALFGPLLGTFLNLIGATAGATTAFLISRYAANGWFQQQNNQKMSQLIQRVDRRGWTYLAVLRVIPILPFNLVNYGMGLTSIKLKDYFLITIICLLPPEILYTYTGYLGGNAILKGSVLHPMLIIAMSSALLFFYLIMMRLKKSTAFAP